MSTITEPLERLADELRWQVRLMRFHLAMKAGFNPDQTRDDHGRWSGDGSFDLDGRKITVELSPSQRASEARLVDANVQALDAAWSRDSGFYIQPGGGGDAIAGRYERFQEWLNSHDTMQASWPGVLDDGRVGFTDGRHRFAVLRDMGVSTLPVAMDDESIRNARHFGYLI